MCAFPSQSQAWLLSREEGLLLSLRTHATSPAQEEERAPGLYTLSPPRLSGQLAHLFTHLPLGSPLEAPLTPPLPPRSSKPSLLLQAVSKWQPFYTMVGYADGSLC